MDRTRLLCDWLKTMSYDQLKALWRCNDAIASLNYERLQHIELEEGLTPAVLAYEGIQYRYMAPHLFSWEQFDYLDRHLLHPVRLLWGAAPLRRSHPLPA